MTTTYWRAPIGAALAFILSGCIEDSDGAGTPVRETGYSHCIVQVDACADGLICVGWDESVECVPIPADQPACAADWCACVGALVCGDVARCQHTAQGPTCQGGRSPRDAGPPDLDPLPDQRLPRDIGPPDFQRRDAFVDDANVPPDQGRIVDAEVVIDANVPPEQGPIADAEPERDGDMP